MTTEITYIYTLGLFNSGMFLVPRTPRKTLWPLNLLKSRQNLRQTRMQKPLSYAFAFVYAFEHSTRIWKCSGLTYMWSLIRSESTSPKKVKGPSNKEKDHGPFPREPVLSKFYDCEPGIHHWIPAGIATRKMCVEFLEPVGGTLRDMEQVKGKEHAPLVSWILIVAIRKENDRSILPSKSSVRSDVDLSVWTLPSRCNTTLRLLSRK